MYRENFFKGNGCGCNNSDSSNLIPDRFKCNNPNCKICGGNGGGKPDSAMAGGKDVSKIPEALAAAEEIVKAKLK